MNFLYFDPGLGAMIVQAVVAAAAGILLFSKNAWYKVKAFFGLLKEEDDTYDSIDIEDNDAETDDTDEHKK
ncbi:hypothetical protein [Marinirhabdus gelatinilytica]|uniref:Uncharacterized protein n=1 Tax=Marinirhabdus gelatinilytica TaxID=1703343 RepID=A0A370Q4D6_9FLAO|nr:hypothetical protein [Marinirhabdus gelatinilytica]RDK83248.1 hypothetical protein C8D94_10836 [Marinirhabdus gelatinilytica]